MRKDQLTELGLYLPPGTAFSEGAGVGLQLGGNLANSKTEKKVVSMGTVLGDERAHDLSC